VAPTDNQTDSELVNEISKSHHSSIRHSILLVTLGVCVFLWGLGYKLSLYEFHEASVHRIPDAKLLSRNEDSSATDSVRLCLFKLSASEQGTTFAFVLFVISLASVAGPSSAGAGHYLTLSKPWCLRLAASLSALFLRPPPVLSEQ
jgi:hypothetical protein